MARLLFSFFRIFVVAVACVASATVFAIHQDTGVALLAFIIACGCAYWLVRLLIDIIDGVDA